MTSDAAGILSTLFPLFAGKGSCKMLAGGRGGGGRGGGRGRGGGGGSGGVLPRDKLVKQAVFEGMEKVTATKLLEGADTAVKTWLVCEAMQNQHRVKRSKVKTVQHNAKQSKARQEKAKESKAKQSTKPAWMNQTVPGGKHPPLGSRTPLVASGGCSVDQLQHSHL